LPPWRRGSLSGCCSLDGTGGEPTDPPRPLPRSRAVPGSAARGVAGSPVLGVGSRTRGQQHGDMAAPGGFVNVWPSSSIPSFGGYCYPIPKTAPAWAQTAGGAAACPQRVHPPLENTFLCMICARPAQNDPAPHLCRHRLPSRRLDKQQPLQTGAAVAMK